MQKIATYGSLKRGFFNHNRMGEQTYLGNTVIMGYMTLVYDAYPQLYLCEDGDTHEVEVFEVSDEAFQGLDMMEKGAGYSPIIVETPFGEATMWVYLRKENMGGKPIKGFTKELLNKVYE